jgi:hypothetical protein
MSQSGCDNMSHAIGRTGACRFCFHYLRPRCTMLLISLNVSPKIVDDAEPSRL